MTKPTLAKSPDPIQSTMPPAGRFQILSLDGGGIKGMFAASVLAFIEEDLGTRITDHFDLIAGTSTGGIIALALACGMRPREIVQFYAQYGPTIFSGTGAQRMRAWAKWPFGSKFSNLGLQRALQSCFRDKLLGACSSRVVIPSYDLTSDDVYVFKTPHHPRLRRDHKVPIWKVAMATSAAPTYFPAFRGVDQTRLIDGGMWANNPSALAVAEAVSMLDVPLCSIHLFSLGTTLDVNDRSSRLDFGGLLAWARPSAEVFLHAQTSASFNLAMHLLTRERAVRLNAQVPAGVLVLDRPNEASLMSRSATASRHFVQEFHERFQPHTAPKPTFFNLEQ